MIAITLLRGVRLNLNLLGRFFVHSPIPKINIVGTYLKVGGGLSISLLTRMRP